ncbi:MAG: hypothetical protein ACK4NC_00580 [Candidatus Gracilibacteria bacterium]
MDQTKINILNDLRAKLALAETQSRELADTYHAAQMLVKEAEQIESADTSSEAQSLLSSL